MMAEKDDEFEKQLSVFRVEAFGDVYESPAFAAEEDDPVTFTAYTGDIIESSWPDLPVDVEALHEGREPPTSGCYEPIPSWDRPPGQATRGIDAFKHRL
jgi:hypothetical protein